MAEVVTGEAVALDLTVARFPSRILALMLDVLLQLFVLSFLEIAVFLAAGKHLNGASAAAVFVAGYVLIVVGYPVIFETLSRGRTLGKMALGIRVICDDGSPVRFRQALIRGLALGFIEFWNPLFAIFGLPAGLITSMVSAKGKRLGDMFAGTFVIQERVARRPDLAPVFSVVPPALAGWAQHLELSRLSDATAAAAGSYLRRFFELRSPAREQLGIQLAEAVAAQVSPLPPPGTDAAAYLAAVLAVRRHRELARLQVRYAGQPGNGPGQPWPAQAGQLWNAQAGQPWPAQAGQPWPDQAGQPWSAPAPPGQPWPAPAAPGQRDAQPVRAVVPAQDDQAGSPPGDARPDATRSLTDPLPGAPAADSGFATPF